MTNVQALVDRAMHRNSVSAPSLAALPPPVADEPIAPAAPPTPSVMPAAGAAASSAGPSNGSATPAADRLSPDLKQKLLDADKQRDLRVKAHARAAPVSSHANTKNKSGVFTTSGNKYDPLNSAIQ